MGICYNLKALLILQLWLVGETVNSLAFHASIHGFESRTSHQIINKRLLQGVFFMLSAINVQFVSSFSLFLIIESR